MGLTVEETPRSYLACITQDEVVQLVVGMTRLSDPVSTRTLKYCGGEPMPIFAIYSMMGSGALDFESPALRARTIRSNETVELSEPATQNAIKNNLHI